MTCHCHRIWPCRSPCSSRSLSTSSVRHLRLTLTHENGSARLRLCCGRDTSPGEETLKEQEANFFLAAFARQLDGSVERLDDDPENVIIELTFPLPENTETSES
jgi:hypothetical protein